MNEYSSLPPASPESQPPGLSRFGKHIAIGAVLGGILSSIPLLNCLNLFFCLLNITGIALALMMYFKAHPTDKMTNGEAALFGAAAGAGAGLIASLLGLLLSMLLASAMAGLAAAMAERLPPEIAQNLAAQGAFGLITIPINVILYAGFGALGGFLSLLLFFKTHQRA